MACTVTFHSNDLNQLACKYYTIYLFFLVRVMLINSRVGNRIQNAEYGLLIENYFVSAYRFGDKTFYKKK